MNLKQNIKAINVLEENMGKCFYNFGKKITKIKIQNTKAIKERIDIYDCTHFFFFEALCMAKPLRKVKGPLTNWEKYLQLISSQRVDVSNM